MALTDVDLRQFLVRLATAMLWVFLACSLTLNAFLLSVGSTPNEIVSSQSSSQSSIARSLERWGYGVVRRPIAVTPQNVPSTVQVPPVSSYEAPSGMLPHLTDELPLYRDPGVMLSPNEMTRLWSDLGIAFPPEEYVLQPTLMTWKSGDQSLLFTVDAAKRVMRITNVNTSTEVSAERLPDETLIDFATDHLKAFKIAASSMGAPSLRSLEDGGQVIVSYAKRWQLLPLLNEKAEEVMGAEVRMNATNGSLVDMRLNILHPDILTVSDYPTASAEDLLQAFSSGGLAPIPQLPTGKAVAVSYTSMEGVFLLINGDKNHPSYIVPGIRANWIMEQLCKDCSPVLYSTVIPALDQKQFQWHLTPDPSP
ncbi:MAG: hypothetical protein ABL890_05070 [Candidatus Peribacteraceae bacterium]